MLRSLASAALLLGLAGMGCATAQEADVAGAPEPDALFERMEARVAATEADLIALRHDLHRHPEVSGQEERTAGLVAARLTALGFRVRTGVGGHGVVATLQGGRPGPTVAFRADMDAVPSDAPDPVPYRSEIPGVRHICGHDVHTAVGVGIAEAVAAVRADLPGTLMLVFQPAEERGDGARAMLADEAFASPPDAILALHTAPFPVGQLATTAGGMMAGRARLAVTVAGTGDLDAAAEAVRVAVAGVGTLPPERAFQPAPRGFILVQLFGSGQTVRGQIMTAGPDDRARAEAEVRAALDALDLPDVTLALDYDADAMEGVTNDARLVEVATAAITAWAPEIGVGPVPGAVPAFSEDFGSFQALVPGAMYFLGVNNPETGTVGMPHSPTYVADDAAIAVGTRAMLAAILGRMMDG